MGFKSSLWKGQFFAPFIFNSDTVNNLNLQIDLKYNAISLLQGSKTPSTMEPQNVACIQSMSIYLTLGMDFFITEQNAAFNDFQ